MGKGKGRRGQQAPTRAVGTALEVSRLARGRCCRQHAHTHRAHAPRHAAGKAGRPPWDATAHSHGGADSKNQHSEGAEESEPTWCSSFGEESDGFSMG